MDATELRNLIECPNCGANLPPPSPDGTRTCEFCDTVLSPPAAPQPPVPPQPMAAPPNLGGWSQVSTTPTGMPVTVTYQPAKRSGCGIVVTIFVLVIIASVAIPLYFAFRGSGFGSLFADAPTGDVAVLPAQGPPKSMFTLVRKKASSDYALARIDAGSSTPIWTTPDLNSSSVTNSSITTDGTNVYLPVGSTVMAYRVDNGALAWQAPMSDDFSTSCKSCLFTVGGRLIVESKDYTYHAFDTATGAKAWTRRANTPSAYASPFGDKTMLFDDDANHEGVLVTVKPDGSEESNIKPSCRAKASSFTADFDTDAVFESLPAENAVIVGYGSPYTCWQRIDLGTGQTVWSTSLDSSGSSPSRSRTSLVRQGTKAAVVSDQVAASLDLETGAYHELPPVSDAELAPLGIRENTVILQSKTTRGTTKYSVHAVDLTTGQEAWAIDLGKAGPSIEHGQSTTFVSTGSAQFISSMDQDTLRLVVFDEPTRQLTIHTVAVTTGKDTTQTVASGVDDLLPYFTPVTWSGPTVVITFHDGGIITLDTSTATITNRYP